MILSGQLKVWGEVMFLLLIAYLDHVTHSVKEQRRVRYILRLCCNVEKNICTFQNFAIPYVNVQRWLKH